MLDCLNYYKHAYAKVRAAVVGKKQIEWFEHSNLLACQICTCVISRYSKYANGELFSIHKSNEL